MSELLKCVLSLSLSGTLLILLMFLCKPLFGKVSNRCWQYYLWLIVIARLLLPFAPERSHVLAHFPEDGRTMAWMSEGAGENVPSAVFQEKNGKETGDAPSVASNGESDVRDLWETEALEAVMTGLWAVWLTGVMILFMRRVIDYRRYIKGIEGSTFPVSDLGMLDLLAECGEQIGVKRPVELAVNEAISSPMLIGCFHPRILLPTADLPASDLRYIFLHELTHERRKDILYKWLVQFTLCMHWFNPFVWLMSREIDRACELACDEAVISRLGDEERMEYGDMLVNAVKIQGIRHSMTAFMALYESKKMMKERLGQIMKFQKRTKWVVIGSFFLALCLFAVSMVEGAYLVPSTFSSVEENDSDEPGGISSHTYGSEEAVDFGKMDGAAFDESAGRWERGNFIDEAEENFTIHNECSRLGEEQVAYISNIVVQNVLERHEGIYSFDNMEVTLYRQVEDGDGLVVDVEVGAITTLIRAPEDAPFVQGMKAVMEELGNLEEARQVLDAYLKEATQYYNVPSDYATGFCYRVYISATGEYKFYHLSGPDEDPDLTEMFGHEIFTEIFTEEDGREYMREEVERIMTEKD